MAVFWDCDKSGRRLCGRCAFLLGLAGWVALSLAIGCTSSSSQPRRQPPITLVVQNNCDADLRSVSLRGPAQPDGQADSFGTISPVPRGTRQVLGRRLRSVPLPAIVEMVWTDARDQSYNRQIALERLIRQAVALGRNTLVFEIGPEGKLLAHSETR